MWNFKLCQRFTSAIYKYSTHVAARSPFLPLEYAQHSFTSFV